jgi:hypothetical protein
MKVAAMDWRARPTVLVEHPASCETWCAAVLKKLYIWIVKEPQNIVLTWWRRGLISKALDLRDSGHLDASFASTDQPKGSGVNNLSFYRPRIAIGYGDPIVVESPTMYIFVGWFTHLAIFTLVCQRGRLTLTKEGYPLKPQSRINGALILISKK